MPEQFLSVLIDLTYNELNSTLLTRTHGDRSLADELADCSEGSDAVDSVSLQTQRCTIQRPDQSLCFDDRTCHSGQRPVMDLIRALSGGNKRKVGAALAFFSSMQRPSSWMKRPRLVAGRSDRWFDKTAGICLYLVHRCQQ